MPILLLMDGPGIIFWITKMSLYQPMRCILMVLGILAMGYPQQAIMNNFGDNSKKLLKKFIISFLKKDIYILYKKQNSAEEEILKFNNYDY